ncbi:GDSL-type esterase/lipase family protein [Ruminococcus sp. Marseille-P6503]|uniref:GDSL-type esterase/lipase family protein n=1 Tax=Ruminococcus sp. Marseille-P6503 TaxID=2364796 RepID=UPI000F5290F0|nr:GDSL-type esterase/lipase family protein [Ruminococcus sp. Marseille-P6503]
MNKNAEELNQTQRDKIQKLEAYRRANLTAQKGQIVCAGSSLMEMFPIEKLLKESGSDRIVYNRGIGGYVTAELLNAVDVCVTDLMPSRVFINIGTNDLSDSRIPMDTIMKNYDAIITKIEETVPEVEIYLMAYYPVNREAASPETAECLKERNNDKISRANELVKRLAEKHSQRYVDINANLKDEKGRLKAEYTTEGIHIKEEGYRAIFNDFMKYINEPEWTE